MKKIDLSGSKFGRLTVIKSNGKTTSGNILWECECDCGNKSTVSSSNLRRGTTQSCGCIQKERTSKIHKLPDGVSSFNNLFSNYKRGAEKRGLKFELSEDEFMSLTKQSCHYCGVEPSQIYGTTRRTPYVYSGVDRIENNIGYVDGNCVPCCKMCNYAKRTMEYSEFIDWICRVYSNIKKGQYAHK